MKRDFDLLRSLLVELEGESPVDLSSYSQDQLNYHKALLKEAGLVEAIINYPTSHQTDIPDLAMLTRLTWEGHEFLDRARSETTWNSAKKIVTEKGLSLSVEAIKIGLSLAIKSAFT